MTTHLQQPTGLITAEMLFDMGDDAGHCELVAGEVTAMPPVGDDHGAVALDLSWYINTFVRRERLGVVYAAETGFILARNPDTVRAPDVAFVRAERVRPRGQRTGYVPFAPDLAVEVVSPNDRLAHGERTVQEYLAAGTRLVWVAHPAQQTVTVYAPDQAVRVLGVADELDGGGVLPGFRLAVARLFEDD